MTFLDTHVVLWEIGNVMDETASIFGVPERGLDLLIETDGWIRAAQAASHLSWTRDPFDRLITAHALVHTAPLCSRDKRIRDHYWHAFWA